MRVIVCGGRDENKLQRLRPRRTERVGYWLALAGDVVAVSALAWGPPAGIWFGVGLHLVGWLLCGNFVARNLFPR